MNILVFDSNLVYAKKIGEMLEQHVKEAHIFYASDVPVLCRRLATLKLDLILADVFTAFEADRLLVELKHTHVPVVVWSSLDAKHVGDGAALPSGKVLTKPQCDRELEVALSSLSLAPV